MMLSSGPGRPVLATLWQDEDMDQTKRSRVAMSGIGPSLKVLEFNSYSVKCGQFVSYFSEMNIYIRHSSPLNFDKKMAFERIQIMVE